MDGFGSDTDEFESGYHLLPHFNSNTNTKRMVRIRIRIRMFTQNQLEIIFLKFNLDE